MVLVLVQSTDALRVDDNDIDLFAIRRGAFNGRTPAPESFGAGIDSVTHSKAATLIQQHSIEQVRLAGSVKACNRYNPERFLDLTEEISAFFINLVL
jgi:hypothetical protein